MDDFRESPALEIARALSLRHPGRVACADPFAAALQRQAPAVAADLALVDGQAAVGEADIIAILVPHSSFRSLVVPEGRQVVDIVGMGR